MLDPQIIRVPFPKLLEDDLLPIASLADGLALMYSDGTWETFVEGRLLHAKYAIGVNIEKMIDMAKYYIEIEHGYEHHSVVVMQDRGDERAVVLVAKRSSGLW